MRLGNVTFIKNNAATRFKFLDCVPATNNVYWQLIMYVKDPILAQSSLRKYGIDSATSSLIEISSLDKYPFIKSTPNAKRLLTNGLFIPCFAQLNMNEIQRIVRVLRYCEKELT
jgi:dTDP-4-amino-4,6-dideoxygalactose transaminase